MSGNDHNIQAYTSSDIEKYLNGELSAPQMHALEKAALEDPFLADAIEGATFLRQSPAASFQNDLAELRQRLADQTTKKAAPIFRFNYRAAAAVILLVGLGLTAYFAIFNKSSQLEPATIAKADVEKQAPAPIMRKDSVAPVTAEAPPAAAPITSVVPDKPTQTHKPANEEEAFAQKKETTLPAKQFESVTQALKDRTQGLVTITDTTNDLAANNTWKAVTFNNDKQILRSVTMDRANFKKADTFRDNDKYSFKGTVKDTNLIADQLVFTGKVTDFKNNALPGASLYVPGHEKIMAITDRNGNFALHLKKADSVNKLAVASVGYEPAYIALDVDNKNANFIQLKQQETSLNEVVVSGYGSKRKEVFRRNIDAPFKPLSLIALPADGWPAYNNYIESTKKIFKLDSTLAGNETISFIVHQSGKLTSFKVEQSISPAHDSAAIRLVRQGPAWKLMKGRNERAVVSISFP